MEELELEELFERASRISRGDVGEMLSQKEEQLSELEEDDSDIAAAMAMTFPELNPKQDNGSGSIEQINTDPGKSSSQLYGGAYRDPTDTALRPIREDWSPTARYLHAAGFLLPYSYKNAKKLVDTANNIWGQILGVLYHGMQHPLSMIKIRQDSNKKKKYRFL